MTPNTLPPDPDLIPDGPAGPTEPAEGDPGAPRRSASAQFVVDSTAGSAAMLREAMDPANQSLRDALRLSFRVLQVVILVMIVLFVFSGFKTVEVGQSGVMLRWGAIMEPGGRAALDPGPKFSIWPYPAGEFVLFEDNDRYVEVLQAFWPAIAKGRTVEQAVQAASTHDMLRPGPLGQGDGSLLTSGGDIAHLQLTARYDVDDPRAFVTCVENRDPRGLRLDADRLVRLALQRAAVHVAAQLDLQEFAAFADTGKRGVLQGAQDLLSAVDAGIALDRVDTPVDPSPAFFIRKEFAALHETREQATQEVLRAAQEAERALGRAAGDEAENLVADIEAYEVALELGETAEAEARLAAIDQRLEGPTTAGEAASIINRAKAYRAEIASTLGDEASRLAGLRDAYRRNPDLVVRRLWADALAAILSRDDAETVYVPDDVGSISIALAGLDHVRQTRRQRGLDRREREALIRGEDLENPYIPGASEMEDQFRRRPGRSLDSQGRGAGRR